MRDVAIIGVGRTKVGEHWDRTLSDLGVEAATATLADAGLDSPQALYVGNMLAGRLSSQLHLGALLADHAGLAGVEAVTIEAAEASGGAAVHQAYLAVAGGLYDTVLVVGVEKMTDFLPDGAESALALGMDGDFEAIHGLTPNALSALLMRRYLHEIGLERSDFAPFVVNAHLNARDNPWALYPRPVSFEAYLEAPPVAEPLGVLDCCSPCDGAAAVVLCAARQARRYRGLPARVLASTQSHDRLALQDRTDILALQAARESARHAYSRAGLGPEDVRLFEPHDATTILTALSLEACGFAERGGAVELARQNAIARTGRLPITTCGGLKARGNPVGATGLYQIVEAVLQLRDQAGVNQVENCRVAMTQNLGGSGATAVTHILGR